MADKKIVTFKHPRLGTTMHGTKDLRDKMTGNRSPVDPSTVALSQDDTRGSYQATTEAPSPNGSTAEWREYRLANGYNEKELDGLGRNDLRDLDDR